MSFIGAAGRKAGRSGLHNSSLGRDRPSYRGGQGGASDTVANYSSDAKVAKPAAITVGPVSSPAKPTWSSGGASTVTGATRGQLVSGAELCSTYLTSHIAHASFPVTYVIFASILIYGMALSSRRRRKGAQANRQSIGHDRHNQQHHRPAKHNLVQAGGGQSQISHDPIELASIMRNLKPWPSRYHQPPSRPPQPREQPATFSIQSTF